MVATLADTLSLRVSLEEMHGMVVGSAVGSFLKHLALAMLGLAALLAPYFLGPARGAELEGPVAAHVTRVIDGDTAEVEAHVWVRQSLDIRVRLADIDAPEIGSHAGCDFERRKAEEARKYLTSLIEDKDVELTAIKDDKYGGRVDANMQVNGRDVSDLMLKKHLALAYDGGHKTPWCEAAERAHVVVKLGAEATQSSA